ncbi:MAG: signal peptidase II [Rickettsiales bacterium]|nr:signal peptidase II [Rickettsiales bacterium]
MAFTKLTRQWGLLTAATVFVLDQITKWVILDVVELPVLRSIEVTSFFNLTMVWNYGVSFGMLAHPGTEVPYFLIVATLVIVVALVVWLRKVTDRYVALGLGFIIGGALGNIIDRIRFGAVADFLDVHAYGYHWPAFNVADSAIFIGVIILLWDGLLRKSPSA